MLSCALTMIMQSAFSTANPEIIQLPLMNVACPQALGIVPTYVNVRMQDIGRPGCVDINIYDASAPSYSVYQGSLMYSSTQLNSSILINTTTYNSINPAGVYYGSFTSCVGYPNSKGIIDILGYGTNLPGSISPGPSP